MADDCWPLELSVQERKNAMDIVAVETLGFPLPCYAPGPDLRPVPARPAMPLITWRPVERVVIVEQAPPHASIDSAFEEPERWDGLS